MNANPFALLVMAYGTPHSLDEVEAYYTDIRRGRPPTPEQLNDLIRRYEAIGGVSPLNDITVSEGEGIAKWVNQNGWRPCQLYLGMKHTHPFIREAVHQIANDGLTDVVSLVLAPHYSTMSVGTYQKNADEAAASLEHPLRFLHVNQWHLQPRFLNVLQTRVQEALAACQHPEQALVVFTAHSLPERILAVQDPYPTQIRETGQAVAEALNLKHVDFAWQSAGRTPEPWLGPDILDYLPIAAERGFTEVVICPCGFVSDHLEVLYDIDIEAQQLVKSLGIRLIRTRSLNADPEFLTALAEAVLEETKQWEVSHG